MKKFANTIFGKESKYHHREGEQSEAFESEKYHTKYDEHLEPAVATPPQPSGPPPVITAVPVVPVVEKKPSFEDKLAKELEIERRYRDPEQRVEYTRTEEPIRRTELREEDVTETKILPSVIHERVHAVEDEEIQPIVHRDIEKTEIHLITEPRSEREVRPTVIQEGVLPAEYRPDVRMNRQEADERLRALETAQTSHLERAPAEHKVYEKAPIIEETIHRRIIEEVQPIIHKETVEPIVIRETRPIYEKVIEAPVITSVTREMERMSVKTTAPEHHVHHHHHEAFLRGESQCVECNRSHRESKAACQFCQPAVYSQSCGDCQTSRQGYGGETYRRGPSYQQASYDYRTEHQHHYHPTQGEKGTPTGPAEARVSETRPGPSY